MFQQCYFKNSFTIAPVPLYRVVRVSGSYIPFVTLFQPFINIMFWCCLLCLRCLWKSVVKPASSVELSVDKILCCLAVIILMGQDVRDTIIRTLIKQPATSYSKLVKITKRDYFVRVIKVLHLENKICLTDRIINRELCGNQNSFRAPT
jgi:hypothetical protein